MQRKKNFWKIFVWNIFIQILNIDTFTKVLNQKNRGLVLLNIHLIHNNNYISQQ